MSVNARKEHFRSADVRRKTFFETDKVCCVSIAVSDPSCVWCLCAVGLYARIVKPRVQIVNNKMKLHPVCWRQS